MVALDETASVALADYRLDGRGVATVSVGSGLASGRSRGEFTCFDLSGSPGIGVSAKGVVR